MRQGGLVLGKGKWEGKTEVLRGGTWKLSLGWVGTCWADGAWKGVPSRWDSMGRGLELRDTG